MPTEIPPTGSPANSKVDATAIKRSEADIGDELRRECARWFELSDRVVDVAGTLLGAIEDERGDARAIHVGAFMLARVVTDLRAVGHLVRCGYPMQALAQVGTALEVTHALAYVGANETRAQEWLSHDDLTRAYPPIGVKATIQAVASAIGVTPDMADREYQVIYRDVCMAKHANPISFGTVGFVAADDVNYVTVGPYLSDGVRRTAHVALQHATRYGILACIIFARDHIPVARSGAAFEALTALSGERKELMEAVAKIFPPEQRLPGAG
jgi:hypothetical protein